jgi:hypothetical protein
MIVVLALRLNLNALKNCTYYIYSFAIKVKPNRLIAYLLELYLVLLLFANAISLYVKKT